MRDQAAIFFEAEQSEKVRKTICFQHRDERSSCKESSKLRNLSKFVYLLFILASFLPKRFYLHEEVGLFCCSSTSLMQLASMLIQLKSRTPEKIQWKTNWKRNNRDTCGREMSQKVLLGNTSNANKMDKINLLLYITVNC
jgi:hypothetical protein